jgi:hypothetical protein
VPGLATTRYEAFRWRRAAAAGASWRPSTGPATLSNDTFLRRVDRALRARRVDELAGLLSDLPPVPDEGAGPGRAAKAWSRLTDRLGPVRFRAAWPAARPPRLVLPRPGRHRARSFSPERDRG